MKDIQQQINDLKRAGITKYFAGNRKGIEREGLRVLENGKIAATPHPKGLGSALTNSYITTDYSEALLEFITPVFTDNRELLQFLEDLHRYTLQNMPKNEIFWHFSMPCIISAENEIPIADYGTSNAGMMKNIYRRGLGHRYGRHMQTISGIHYNFSFSNDFWNAFARYESTEVDKDYISRRYMDLIRNFQRNAWVLIYFFGASPSLCQSFIKNNDKHNLDYLSHHSYGRQYGTSLRLSDLGYTNDSQQELNISTNSLQEYISGLRSATELPSKAFEKIGIEVEGQYRQLNSNVLQIENEFYSTVRPKQPIKPFEKPTTALLERGIEYIEIRALDVNPFAPSGISQEQIAFLELFLTWCLLNESPALSPEELQLIQENDNKIIHYGRQQNLILSDLKSGQINRSHALTKLIKVLEPLATEFDKTDNSQQYSKALHAMNQAVIDPSKTPSGRIMELTHESDLSFYKFAKEQSLASNSSLRRQSLAPANKEKLLFESTESLQKQWSIEQSDEAPFTQFLEDYFSRP